MAPLVLILYLASLLIGLGLCLFFRYRSYCREVEFECWLIDRHAEKRLEQLSQWQRQKDNENALLQNGYIEIDDSRIARK